MATARYTDKQWEDAKQLLAKHLDKVYPDGKKSINPWRTVGVYTVFHGGKAIGRFFMEDLAKGLVKAK